MFGMRQTLSCRHTNKYKVRINNNNNNNNLVPNTFTSATADVKLVSPIKIYPNADTQKLFILKENKGSSGVYR